MGFKYSCWYSNFIWYHKSYWKYLFDVCVIYNFLNLFLEIHLATYFQWIYNLLYIISHRLSQFDEQIMWVYNKMYTGTLHSLVLTERLILSNNYWENKRGRINYEAELLPFFYITLRFLCNFEKQLHKNKWR